LADLRKDPDLYGILQPIPSSHLGIRAIDSDTALLYLKLQQPGALPAYVVERLGSECQSVIAELVLDSVLESEEASASEEFVTGSDAWDLLFEEAPTSPARSTVARLSVEALKYAQALEITQSGKLSARMYFYNRLPASGEAIARLPTPEAVAK